MDLTLLTNGELRDLIRGNVVSFPSPVPGFTKGSDLQERIVLLYFIRAWEVRAICTRYGLTKSTVRKHISDWTVRAVAASYIQEITELSLPESFLPAA